LDGTGARQIGVGGMVGALQRVLGQRWRTCACLKWDNQDPIDYYLFRASLLVQLSEAQVDAHKLSPSPYGRER